MSTKHLRGGGFSLAFPHAPDHVLLGSHDAFPFARRVLNGRVGGRVGRVGSRPVSVYVFFGGGNISRNDRSKSSSRGEQDCDEGRGVHGEENISQKTASEFVKEAEKGTSEGGREGNGWLSMAFLAVF